MRIVHTIFVIASLTLLTSSLVISTAQALSTVPNVVELNEGRGPQSANVKVYNDTSNAVPVELLVEQIEVDEAGNKIRSSAEGNLIVFPPRSLIEPGETQIVNVVWQGNDVLETSRSYFVTVRQVPVRRQADKSKIRAVMNFRILVNVAPADGQANLNIVDIATENRSDAIPARNDQEGGSVRRNVIVIVENTGNRHARFTSGRLTVSGEGWETTLTSDDLSSLIGVGLVQPGKRRRLVVPVTVPAGIGPLRAVYHPR